MQKQNIGTPALSAGATAPLETGGIDESNGGVTVASDSGGEEYQTREGCLGLSITLAAFGIVFVGVMLLIGGFE